MMDGPRPAGSVLAGHSSRLANAAAFLFAQLMRIRVMKHMARIQYTLPVNRDNWVEGKLVSDVTKRLLW